MQGLRRYQEEYEEKCRKLQQAFDAEIQAFGVGDEDNDDDNNTDKNTINSSPMSSGNVVNGPSKNGTSEGSPGVGPHVSSIMVNGAKSPVMDNVMDNAAGDGQEATGDEKLDSREKVNSKEELTNM